MRRSAFVGISLAAAVVRGLGLMGLARPLGIQSELLQVPNRAPPARRMRVWQQKGATILHEFRARKRPFRTETPLLRAEAIDRNRYSGADLRAIRADPDRAECRRRKAKMQRIAARRAGEMREAA